MIDTPTVSMIDTPRYMLLTSFFPSLGTAVVAIGGYMLFDSGARGLVWFAMYALISKSRQKAVRRR
jgi:hypothetical protein